MLRYCLFSLLLLPCAVNAQSEVDALRYSFLTLNGGARYQASAGAFGALGADLSCMHNNPAGLGRFRYSEIGITFGLQQGQIGFNFQGISLFSSKTRI